MREDTVGQTSGAGYAELQTQWSEVVRTTIGVRGDLYRWKVDAGDPVNGGTASDGIVNPKFSIAFGPWRRTELYASAGGGFHSNDGRGATIRRDPVSGDAVDPVDPLVRARGAEVGLRTLALPRLHTTLATWGLWLDSELLFIGDAGTTEASRPSRRMGFEWDADYRATPLAGARRQRRVLAGALHRRRAGRRSHPRGDRRRGQRRDAIRPARPLERQPALAILRSTAAHRGQQRAQPRLKPR